MTITLVSPGEIHLNGPSSSSSGCVECVRIMFTIPGIMREKTCFPEKKKKEIILNSITASCHMEAKDSLLKQ
jgi:hypothetical protein